jgi:hypothetical protein
LINLRELKFERINPDLLKAINCPQLQKMTINGGIWCEDSKNWKQFVERHRNIDFLEITVKKRNSNSEPHYIKCFKYLSKLKTLKYHDFVEIPDGILSPFKIIADNLTGLAHLEIVVREENVEKAVAYLRRKFSHLRCDTRKIQNVKGVRGTGKENSERGLDRLIVLRKI